MTLHELTAAQAAMLARLPLPAVAGPADRALAALRRGAVEAAGAYLVVATEAAAAALAAACFAAETAVERAAEDAP